ncbi:MAG: 50S ribosomal protein L30 [Gammaproteobacteria bacterium]|nr:50S ribosomal protein L30 [Gammaproteobacteria bacterium]MCY4356037.1 50S ribosomal protein L30 [Gammaproteobacteria bacterium]
MATSKTVKVTLVRSPIGTLPRHKLCLKGLGLRRMHQTVEVEDTPAVRGMINKISYMLAVEQGAPLGKQADQ